MNGPAQGTDATASGCAAASDYASLPEIARATMEVDIACVGFGPAMGGFLTTLTREWAIHPDDPAFIEQGCAGNAATSPLLRARQRSCRRSQRHRDQRQGDSFQLSQARSG